MLSIPVCRSRSAVRLAHWAAVLSVFIALFVGTFLPFSSADAQVRVRGYFRKNGTYVQPHYRSSPDGNPYNNWSFPGNTNPYTGEVAQGNPETYLRNYYQRDRSSTGTSLGSSSYVTPARPSPLPSVEVERSKAEGTKASSSAAGATAVLPHYVAQEDLQRSRDYCHRIYAAGSPYREPCELEQYRTLARLVLPDYSTLPKQEVGRSAGYCERIYSDNRAAFYDCVNDQILGLHRGRASFSGIESGEALRAENYCDRIYGDNRAAAAGCTRDQARGLVGAAPDVSSLPPAEWGASNRYCERIYGDNRAAVLNCKRNQARGLDGAAPDVAGLPDSEWSVAAHYCERIYGDNRSAVLRCKRDQATGIRRYLDVAVSEHVPSVEWQQAVNYCERIYSDNRAATLRCRDDQARSLELAGRTGLFNRSVEPERRAYCERIYSGNRSAVWNCIARP